MPSEANSTTSRENQGTFNQEQYDILKRCSDKRNIAEWNSYRAEHPETTIRLQNADLRGGSLEGAQLSEANLAGARFERADLLAADLRNADLRKANFENANLWGVTLSEANLEGARLVSCNLENADLRGANLVRADLRGTNLEEAIADGIDLDRAAIRIDAEDCRPGWIEEAEVVFDLADDITYGEFMSLMRCMETLSLIVGGSPPHLIDVQISHHIEEHAARRENEMENMVSVIIPMSIAENLREIFLWGMTAGQAGNEGAMAETVGCKRDSGACDHLRELLTNAGFSENQRETILANQTLSSMDVERMMKDIHVVANLVGGRRIYFQA
ncbi:MAG: pentapeptide repeat-containing protein [Planctomycetota bacterium]|jgi:uncharacterized protein YjbI with pentapeptide repeats